MESYQLTQQLFQSLTQKWQDEYSYQENIRYLVTNIIAQRIFGIPEVPIEEMKVLQDMSYALANHQPDSEAFKKAAETFQKSSDKLVQRFGRNILDAKKYAFDQIREDDNSLERLADIKVGSDILVEGNLSNTIMIAIAQLLENKDLLEELRSELVTLDLNTVPNNEEHAKELYTSLNRCTLLQKIYVEALRFVSAGGITARKTSRASEWDVKDKEGNTRHFSVPKGSFLFAPLRMMAHDQNFFKDPEIFNPHRFDNCETPREFNLLGLSPFITGIRSCPAEGQFAKLVFKLAVSITITQHRGLKLDKNMQTIAANSMHPVMEPPCYRVSEEEPTMNMAALP